jgi:hypothetical protein
MSCVGGLFLPIEFISEIKRDWQCCGKASKNFVSKHAILAGSLSCVENSLSLLDHTPL